jgi:hypothetical protein
VTDPAPLETAAASVWTVRVVAFTGWVGTGRKLTQNRRITLADARELVDLLDTDDVIDPTVGGRVFRTRSSEQLPTLNAVVEWAKASRLVRVTGAKLVPVAKNAPLLEQPVALWQRMFEVFGKLGPAICPAGWGESLLRHHFDDGITTALTMLHTHHSPTPLAEIQAHVWQRISAGYRLRSTPETHQATWRRCNDRDVRRALAVLSQFGAIRIDGPDQDPLIALTPLGDSSTARLVRSSS